MVEVASPSSPRLGYSSRHARGLKSLRWRAACADVAAVISRALETARL